VGRARFAGKIADTDPGPAFAAAWERQTGQAARVTVRSRLYRLGTLAPPDPAPPGCARVGGGQGPVSDRVQYLFSPR
jgi:hypothetical protein